MASRSHGAPPRDQAPPGTRRRTALHLVFVGERRSARARRLGITWLDGRLSGKTLHDALRACAVDPAAVAFVNLFHDAKDDPRPCENALLAIRSLAATGAVVIALGRRVQAGLHAAGVPYVPLTHPAARGAVRARPVYQRLVAEALRNCRPARHLPSGRRTPPVSASERAAA